MKLLVAGMERGDAFEEGDHVSKWADPLLRGEPVEVGLRGRTRSGNAFTMLSKSRKEVVVGFHYCTEGVPYFPE